MSVAVARHERIVQDAVAAHGGVVLKSRGEGDSTFSVFASAQDALDAAAHVLQAVDAEAWPERTPVRLRAAVHTGPAELRDGDYFGASVNRAARLRELAHAGQ